MLNYANNKNAFIRKKATADSVSRRLQKYLDMTNILQYPEEEFARFDFLVCGPYLGRKIITGADNLVLFGVGCKFGGFENRDSNPRV